MTISALLAGCATQPLRVDPLTEVPDWSLEQVQVFAGDSSRAGVTVSTVRLSRDPGEVAVQLDDRRTMIEQPYAVRVCDDALEPVATAPEPEHAALPEVVVGVTPWAHGDRSNGVSRRVPVGIVELHGERLSAPAPPYWALTLDACGRWGMLPQAEIDPGRHRLALGAFYPLVRDGMVAAGEFPGREIRAARVAIAGLPSGELLLIASTGSRPGPGASRAGLTTGELAELLVQRYRVDWALNLDGGRSAFLQITASGETVTLPARIVRRRPGPVSLRFGL